MLKIDWHYKKVKKSPSQRKGGSIKGSMMEEGKYTKNLSLFISDRFVFIMQRPHILERVSHGVEKKSAVSNSQRP